MKQISMALTLLVVIGCATPRQQFQQTDTKPTKLLIKTSWEISNPTINVKRIPQPPPYPAEAKSKRIIGDVVLLVTINNSGTPITAKAIDGPPELIPTAEQFIMKFVFGNTDKSTLPSETTFQFTMPFRLR